MIGTLIAPQLDSWSITLSALMTIDCGILLPSALAVLMLITSSNFVGCSTAKSQGFTPLNIFVNEDRCAPKLIANIKLLQELA